MIVSVEVVAVMRETERNDPFMKKMNKLLALLLAAAMSIGLLLLIACIRFLNTVN